MEVDGIPYGYSLPGLKFSNPGGLGVVGVGWFPTIVENGRGIELAETSATLDIIGIVVELFKAMDPNVGMDISLMICDKNQTCVDTTKIFSITEKFDTQEEVTRWIREVGIRNRMTVIIIRSDTKTGKRGRSDKGIFGCDKGEKYKEGDSETQSAANKCSCPFKIRSTPSKVLPRNMVNVEFITMVYQIDLKVIRLKTDKSQVVRDIFWAHLESVKLLNMFPSVLVIDNTYKTNKYMQPFFEAVDMTLTELTFSVAFAYMESKKT
ncbi:uncharacterized protein LOC127102157 [Lathyrus oleraceus]|uniref:uncharacterized protein LOC127102157 n=1 Tax=Pisum sativum TaxID=3888 RepID=UPI0021D1E77C|nr:uncharacterized protein LOC127102157 [Pisum sativum]